MPVLDDEEYNKACEKYRKLYSAHDPEGDKHAHRAALHECAAKYNRSFKFSHSELGLPEPRTDWRYRLGQWLIQVGTRVRA